MLKYTILTLAFSGLLSLVVSGWLLAVLLHAKKKAAQAEEEWWRKP